MFLSKLIIRTSEYRRDGNGLWKDCLSLFRHLVIFSLFCSLQLTYSIASGDPDDHLNIKTVKRDRKYLGVVTVKNVLDRETKDLYKVVVSGTPLYLNTKFGPLFVSHQVK